MWKAFTAANIDHKSKHYYKIYTICQLELHIVVNISGMMWVQMNTVWAQSVSEVHKFAH